MTSENAANPTPINRKSSARRYILILLIAGLGIAFVAIPLASIYRRVRAQWDYVECTGNLHELEPSLNLYANDHGGQYPPTLEALVQEGYARQRDIECPSGQRLHGPSGGFRYYPQHQDDPDDWILVIDCEGNHRNFNYLTNGLLTLAMSPDNTKKALRKFEAEYEAKYGPIDLDQERDP